MPDETYHLAPRAEADLLALGAKLRTWHDLGLLTRDAAVREYVADAAKIIAEGRVASDVERMLNVVCFDCRREHRMRADVVEYRCPCDPSRVRYAMTEQADPTTGGVHVPLLFRTLAERPANPFV